MMRNAVGMAIVLGLVLIQLLSAQDQGAQLRKAIFAGDVAQVATLVSSKTSVNSATVDGITPLMIAAALNQGQMVKTLIAAGAAVDAQTTEDKVTALIFAADLGQLDAAQALVEGGAAVKATDKEGYSAIDYAVISNAGATKPDSERTVGVAKYLQTKGAELKKDNSGLGTGVGTGLGNLLAIAGQADLQKLLEKAKAEAR